MKYLWKWGTAMVLSGAMIMFMEFRLCVPSSERKEQELPNGNELHKQHTTLLDKSSTGIWLKQRKELMLSSSHKKVLLFCYMRGGSTFFSELFRQNSEAQFWYEPFDAFYNAKYGMRQWHFPQHIFWYENQENMTLLREIPMWEKKALAEYNHNLFSCNTESLPTETLAHDGVMKSNVNMYIKCYNRRLKFFYDSCLKNISYHCAKSKLDLLKQTCSEQINISNELIFQKKENSHNITYTADFQVFKEYSSCCYNFRKRYIVPCLSKLKEHYNNTKMVAYKALRLTMDSVEHMLQMDPDMYVIYFVRDPRSTVSSRVPIYHTHKLTHNNPVKEAYYHCEKLLHDYKKYQELNVKYPGAIKLIRYEDLNLNTQQGVSDIYDFVEMGIHESVQKWLDMNKNGTSSGGVFSTMRRNSTASINKWKRTNSFSIQTAMTEQCKEVLMLLGYEL